MKSREGGTSLCFESNHTSKTRLICYLSECHIKQREKTLHMRNNGNENRAVWPNGLLDFLETNMVCRYVQNLKSDRLTWGFQNRFGPENWPQRFYI